MRNKFLLLFIFSTWLMGVQAQNHLGAWAKHIEGHENSSFNNVLYDGKDIIVNGLWFLDAKFHEVNLPYHVGSNVLLAKLDTAGNIKWTATITGDSYDGMFDMALDSDKNIVVVGWSTSDIYIEVNGKNVFTPTLQWIGRGMVAKFSGETGDLIWFKTFGPEQQYTSVNGNRIALDKDDNIYIAGYYSAAFMFDELSFHYGQQGWGALPFVIKMDVDGNAVWGQSFNFTSEGENAGYINTKSLAVYNDKLYLAFEYSKPLIINTDTLAHEGWYDWAGIVSLSLSKGKAINHITMGSIETQNIAHIKFDKEDHLLAAGYFTCNSGFKIGNTTLTGLGQYNAYLAKLDTSLTPVWVKTIESTTSSYIFHINIGSTNNYYIGGGYDSSTPILMNGETIVAPSAFQSAAMYQAVIDKSGEFITSVSLTGTNPNSVLNYRNAVLVSDSKMIAVGTFQDSVHLAHDVKLYSDHGSAFMMKWQLPGIQTSVASVLTPNPLGYYPNPTLGTLYIPKHSNPTRIEIYNTLGILVKVCTEDELKTGQISLHDLNGHLYILRTTAASGIYTDKILLSH